MLEGQCKVDPVENKAPVPEKLKTALIAFFKDDEFWCTHQEHDLNLSAAEWMKLTSAVFTARSLCRSSNIPVIPLGDTPFPYKPTDTISGLVRFLLLHIPAFAHLCPRCVTLLTGAVGHM